MGAFEASLVGAWVRPISGGQPGIEGIVLDDADAEKVGEWEESSALGVRVGERYVHSEYAPNGAWPALLVTRTPDHTFGVWGVDETWPVLLCRTLTQSDAFKRLNRMRGVQPVTFEDMRS
jgi:hypothetical protein